VGHFVEHAVGTTEYVTARGLHVRPRPPGLAPPEGRGASVGLIEVDGAAVDAVRGHKGEDSVGVETAVLTLGDLGGEPEQQRPTSAILVVGQVRRQRGPWTIDRRAPLAFAGGVPWLNLAWLAAASIAFF
jgi:hypothetical protein